MGTSPNDGMELVDSARTGFEKESNFFKLEVNNDI